MSREAASATRSFLRQKQIEHLLGPLALGTAWGLCVHLSVSSAALLAIHRTMSRNQS